MGPVHGKKKGRPQEVYLSIEKQHFSSGWAGGEGGNISVQGIVPRFIHNGMSLILLFCFVSVQVLYVTPEHNAKQDGGIALKIAALGHDKQANTFQV